MNNFFYKKSLLLSAIFIASLTGSIIHAGLYDIASAFGDVTDGIITKGELSQENQALFEEVAKKLDIDSRNIKVRNSGLLPRVVKGYNDSFYDPFTNRVYVNEAFLNSLTTEEKKCIFAQQLTHAKKNHAFKKIGAAFGIGVASSVATITAGAAGMIDGRNDNIINKYFTYGIWSDPHRTINISLAGLALAQLCQSYEKDGDTAAVKQIGISNKDAINCIQKIYHPNTDTWPLYAKIQNIFKQVRLLILSLPILKQHTIESASSHDRKDHIETLIPNEMAA